MKQLTLKDRLLRYLRNNPQWIASGELQRIVSAKTSYTPQTTGRVLRQLTEEKLLEVQYRKNHAWYKASSQMTMDEWYNSIDDMASKK